MPVMTDPIAAVLAAHGQATLAFIVNVEGPSYRPVGAAMAILDDGRRVGTLSSGCIEADIATHAQAQRRTGLPKLIRYGRGSPYVDIQLPCGGGMDILILPRPDIAALEKIQADRRLRRPCTLDIDTSTGAMTASPAGHVNAQFRVTFEPDIRFLIFGKGPEAATFAKLVQSAAFPNVLLSPDPETLDAAAGCATRRLSTPAFPPDLRIDNRTAVVLFFHDHDWEPALLVTALASDAFYIGAQGSMRARDTRSIELTQLGVPKAQQDRLHGPVGLIPSARDATTLAVSVLAEVLAQAMLGAS